MAHTDGVPLFVEELTKSVLESELLREAGDQYKLQAPLPALAIPTSLRDSLLARLDRLAPVKEIAHCSQSKASRTIAPSAKTLSIKWYTPSKSMASAPRRCASAIRTQALFNALVLFSVQTQGFSNAQLRTHLANLLGQSPEQLIADLPLDWSEQRRTFGL